MTMLMLGLIMLVRNEVRRRKDSQVARQPVNYLFGTKTSARNLTDFMV